MIVDSLPSIQGKKHLLDLNDRGLDVQVAQEKVYSFFLEIVQTQEPEDVLQEFKDLFINCLDSANSNSELGIYQIFVGSNEPEFRNTLKRTCYILINNWENRRKYKYIQKLIDSFAEYKPKNSSSCSRKINIFRAWLDNFINSKDCQELNLFAIRHEEKSKLHWTKRYSSYLLLAQSTDKNNPKEQQQAAKRLSKQLKDKFKFELAMYIARSQSAASNINRYRNPSILGDEVLRLIKVIVVRKGVFSYENIANIFVKQTRNQSLHEFKHSLLKYLIYSINHQGFIETLEQKLSEKLFRWKIDYDQVAIDKNLLLRTSNKIIDCLISENGKEPSQLFILLLSQGNPLTLVIALLKIVLISKHSRRHLEMRIANIINYYENFQEEECDWVINFIEIFNITFAIYAENVEYNLIKMKEQSAQNQEKTNLDTYRVFSQLKLHGKE
ncbi:hypothetical protein Riv7116_4664 [Rivularia sp. PCC 7116]|uniref:hypothetical protein n=1 Tax=Rivularia sp. PCC 7116 TaxID=373994 RepID=UPI00029F2F8F|nr:hypothetical protein [Rivularia sp. PCC 7116]AFY57083.1 hypothetical protein Riv7116_4664 [Rivularia sp. PCC 7116]